jgi:hypothetical protein
MNYSRRDILSLIRHLRSYHGRLFQASFYKYEVLIGFLRKETPQGLDDGPSASIACLKAVEFLKCMFPDVYYALQMPDSELPLWLSDGDSHEYPVARWRMLRRGRTP